MDTRWVISLESNDSATQVCEMMWRFGMQTMTANDAKTRFGEQRQQCHDPPRKASLTCRCL